MKNIQATGQLYGKTITVQRISKAKALKLFKDNKTVYLQSSNFYPFGVWSYLTPIFFDSTILASSIELREFNKKYNAQYLTEYKLDNSPIKDETYQFNELVNDYKYFNCSYEQGYYVSFYANINDLETKQVN